MGPADPLYVPEDPVEPRVQPFPWSRALQTWAFCIAVGVILGFATAAVLR